MDDDDDEKREKENRWFGFQQSRSEAVYATELTGNLSKLMMEQKSEKKKTKQ